LHLSPDTVDGFEVLRGRERHGKGEVGQRERRKREGKNLRPGKNRKVGAYD